MIETLLEVQAIDTYEEYLRDIEEYYKKHFKQLFRKRHLAEREDIAGNTWYDFFSFMTAYSKFRDHVTNLNDFMYYIEIWKLRI